MPCFCYNIDSQRLTNIFLDDVSSASASLKRELPGSGKEAKKQGEVWAQSAGATLDKTVGVWSLSPKNISFRVDFYCD